MTAITILNKENAPTGPFTRAQVAEKLSAGEISLESLAFVEGLTAWTPLREVLAKVDAVTLPPPPVVPVPGYVPQFSTQPMGHVIYAGFWLRFVAIFIDAIIVGIPMSFIGAIIGGIYGFSYAASHPGGKIGFMDADGNLNLSFIVMEMGVSFFSMTVHWLYFALQESSSAQATLGKRVLGIKVTDLQGQRIGFGRATGRFFGKLVSSFTLLIGYMMAGFTEKKQALHDMLAGTLVVRN